MRCFDGTVFGRRGLSLLEGSTPGWPFGSCGKRLMWLVGDDLDRCR
jgi:hypothetical protein